jgi:peptidoglycan hydrolase-like amidase
VSDLPAAVMPTAAVTYPYSPAGARRGRHVGRRLAALLLAAAVLSTVGLVAEPGVALAGSSCTGWSSLRVPPATIRVLRNGAVKTVDFRRYVGVVMATEWGSYLPQAVLDAAAVAVKQYGWYFTLRGNHRNGFVTSSGECYDVVSTTRDQLYQPGRAAITSKHKRAMNRTWGLSLR